MFDKNNLLVLIILAFGLATCGVQVDNPETSPFAPVPAVPLQGAAGVEDVETIEVSTNTNTPLTQQPLTYPMVDTDQGNCYGVTNEIGCPSAGQSFFGQDAQYYGYSPAIRITATGRSRIT